MTRDEDSYSREFVACLLHSYSVHLSELYDDCRTAKKELEATIRKEEIKSNAGQKIGQEELKQRVYRRIAKIFEESYYVKKRSRRNRI